MSSSQFLHRIKGDSGVPVTPLRLFGVVLLGVMIALLWDHSDSSASEITSMAPEVAGIVRNTEGAPIVNAWVTDGTNYTFTDADGVFVFPQGKVVPGSTLIVSGSGYEQATVSTNGDGEPLNLTVASQGVRGVYFNPRINSGPEAVAKYIELAAKTDVNAVVIDIKDGMVYFDTSVAIYHESGMVLPILDLPWILEEFRKHDIYTIARIVVFKDHVMALKNPHLAVKENWYGNPWYDATGSAWLNAAHPETWEPNIQLAEEAIRLGFDEVQYDYVRFPTDGDMIRIDLRPATQESQRTAAIEGFLKTSRDRLIPLGGRQSADVFGYTTIVNTDLGIGQKLTGVATSVDYISPMIYPSHWPYGSIYVPGHPNDYPYETVDISMRSALKQLDGSSLQLRPWLQDFGMPGLRQYGAAEVKAQIQALHDLGIDSWLLWSFSNQYQISALPPATTHEQAATAIALRADSRRYLIAART